jgi:predicted lipoprotein with Yx(FWY)xxD motif
MIMAAKSDFGTILHDTSGQPIYLFDAESGNRPKCYDDCAKAWPPVLTSGAPRAKGAVRADLLGTTHRSDGSTQITYAGHPLYFYAHEGKFQVLCHNVEEFGGTWLAVQPNGRPAPS